MKIKIKSIAKKIIHDMIKYSMMSKFS